jgi:RNA polymerase sigma-B factor
MRADLEEALVQLKKDERIIIFLAYNEGQSQRQIAEQLGISQMSVSRIQKRAISKLKDLLADQNLSAFLD